MAKRAAPWIPSRPWTDTLSPPHLRGQSWGDTHIFTFCPQHEEGKQRDFRQKHGLPVYLEKSEALARSSQTQPVRPGSQCSRPPSPTPRVGHGSPSGPPQSWHPPPPGTVVLRVLGLCCVLSCLCPAHPVPHLLWGRGQALGEVFVWFLGADEPHSCTHPVK